jgi:predicted acylesterase/phospholipase RssA
VSLLLALEGCAGRAAFQVGALEWLAERGLKPSAAAGASSGSIVAALAGFMDPADMRAAWLVGAGKPIFRPENLLTGCWPFVMSDIVAEALEAALGSARLPQARIPLAIPVTHLGPGGRERRVLTRADDVPVVEAVLGSCFVPGPYVRRVFVDGRLAVDGAWKVRTPVEEALELGPGPCLAIVANPERALYLDFPFSRTRPVPARCHILGPARGLALGPFDTDRGRIIEAMDVGRAAAEAFARSRPDWTA